MATIIVVDSDGAETILVQPPADTEITVVPPAAPAVDVVPPAAPSVEVTLTLPELEVVSQPAPQVVVEQAEDTPILIVAPQTGPAGPQGETGPAGPGLATGGTAGQLLSKVDATDFNTEWVDAPDLAPLDSRLDALEALDPVLEGDPRLTDARTPTAHATSHGSGGADAVTIAQSQVIGLGTALAGKADDADVTALDGRVGTLEALDPVLEGDPRLTDARTPTDHAISHEKGGSDEITLDQSQITDLVSDLADKLPVSNAVALQTFTVNNATPPTKGYRFRTTGGALDLEVSNADLHISVWDGAGFTGTQRTAIRINEAGEAEIFALRSAPRLIGEAHLTSSFDVPATTSDTTFMTTGTMTFRAGRAYRMEFVANHQTGTGPTQPIKYAAHKGTTAAGEYWAGYYYAPAFNGTPTPSTITVSQYLINETGSDIVTQVNMTVAFGLVTGTARIYVDAESKCFMAFSEVGDAADFPFAKSIT